MDGEKELSRLLMLAHFADSAPLGTRPSRDVEDDGYLGAALGARAECVVSNDRDLLALGKPFGVAIVTPVEFVQHIRAADFL